MKESYQHPETLEETPPSFLLYLWDQGSSLISTYGWFILGISLVIVYYWQTIQSHLDNWYKEQSEKEYAARCKKDPDWMRRRQVEMEAARKKMQEDLDAKAALQAVKLKEKEELRRAELLVSSAGRGEKLGDGGTTITNETVTPNSTKKSYRPEYNPLMGSGGNGGYRPPRRGCPGGGCGR